MNQLALSDAYEGACMRALRTDDIALLTRTLRLLITLDPERAQHVVDLCSDLAGEGVEWVVPGVTR